MPDGQQRIGIIGLGYVGLPLALAFTEAGYSVIGVDLDEKRVQSLQHGESYIRDVSDHVVDDAVSSGLEPTTDYAKLESVSLVSICVPTPYSKTGQPEVSYVAEAVSSLADVLSRGCTVVLESTVYPSATEELVAETFTENGWQIGKDIYVAHSPERIDPGNDDYGHTEIPKVVGGVTDACGDRAEAWYSEAFAKIVRVSSAREAEMTKLLENTFRSINIGMINEMTIIANELDIDIWEVIDAASTKPFGFMPFYPGPGLGGHCIPVDPQFLSWKANQHETETRFIDLADRINREMPEYVVERLIEALNKEGTAVSQSEVLVLGVSYKPDVPDTRESPAYDIIERIRELGGEVMYHDPHVKRFEVNESVYESTELTEEVLESVNSVVIITDHSEINIKFVADHSNLVLDTRNATAGIERNNIERL